MEVPNCFLESLYEVGCNECDGVYSSKLGRYTTPPCKHKQECMQGVRSKEAQKTLPVFNNSVIQQRIVSNVQAPQLANRLLAPQPIPMTQYQLPPSAAARPQLPTAPQIVNQAPTQVTQRPQIPQQVQQPQLVPVKLPEINMAAANFAVPAYLTVQEPKKKKKMKALGVELARSAGKSMGQTLAHFFDSVSLLDE